VTKAVETGIRWLARLGVLWLVAFVFVPEFYKWVDATGRISHEEESSIAAQTDWFVGESKYCQSSPILDVPRNGYAVASLKCDEGPEHLTKIHFGGREQQPEYVTVYRKCAKKAPLHAMRVREREDLCRCCTSPAPIRLNLR
jgi:hypothetical protein